MQRILIAFVLVFALASLAATAQADPAVTKELADHGPQGEYFLDTGTGYYWFDPEVFLGIDRYTVNVFVTCSRTWEWATSAEVDQLLGGRAPAGLTLEDVMGADQIDISGRRWLGFYADEVPDGYLVQSIYDPYVQLHESGSQAGAASLTHGAWIKATVDPLFAPRLENLGESGEFFHDRFTDLYWQDPANFVGMDRTQIEAWLTANPGWRWATREEIEGLVGMLSEGDVPLTEILGEPQQIVTGPAPRWIGYYAQETQPDGMLLQADLLPPYTFAAGVGTQGGVSSLNPGAWIVTDDVSVPVTPRSWGSFKAEFR